MSPLAPPKHKLFVKRLWVSVHSPKASKLALPNPNTREMSHCVSSLGQVPARSAPQPRLHTLRTWGC